MFYQSSVYHKKFGIRNLPIVANVFPLVPIGNDMLEISIQACTNDYLRYTKYEVHNRVGIHIIRCTKKKHVPRFPIIAALQNYFSTCTEQQLGLFRITKATLNIVVGTPKVHWGKHFFLILPFSKCGLKVAPGRKGQNWYYVISE